MAKPMTRAEWQVWIANEWGKAVEAARAQKQWVGLTDEEIVGMTCECVDDGTFDMNCARDFARAIEEKSKEKNS